MTIVLVKEKRIYALIVFALIVFFNQQATAQTDLEKRQQANKTFDEHLNKVYENNLPNKKSTTYSALTPAEIAAGWKGGKTMSEKERYNAENLGSKQMIYNEYTEHWDALYSINKININQSDSKLLDATMHNLAAKSHLYLADKIDWYKDLYFSTAMNSDLVLQLRKIKALDYDSASDAALEFSKETSTKSYDELTDLIKKASILPMSARNMILYLYKKYPERQQQTELLELQQLPYFFGANRPYLFPNWSRLNEYTNNPYPGSYYENAGISAEARSEILERFINLATKYPKEGLVAAGFCRPQLNPFTLYAETKANLSDLQKKELYWNALHIKRIPAETAYTDNRDMEYVILRKPLAWLIRYDKDGVKSLSPAEWTDIADQTIGGIFRMRNFNFYVQTGKYKGGNVSMRDNFGSLDNAYKIAEKEWKAKAKKKDI
ncbi:hypothetical protein [Pedobacter agri]|uniref:Gliding motility protein GldN n=1 Tax=Pedobacter agri TaxID=454586 RepID=A0A9X3DEX5_9SPHI|nr:hypothetical protein [Pedobacter agri]MCX3264891.1 hypothetical protein [Pedobacter agri]